MTTIPIRNLWLLQFFASDLFRIMGSATVAAEDAPEDLPDLVGRILTREVTTRLHRGLSVGFRSVARNEHRVRGRINQLVTTRGRLLDRGLVNCTFDEIITDTPGNRLVRAALERAATLVPVEPQYRSLALQLQTAGVVGPPPRLVEVTYLRRQRLLERDRTMLAAAELLLSFAIPSQADGDMHLPRPDDDDRYLRKLFEHAAFGLYRHYLTPRGWTVDHGTIQRWQVSDESAGMTDVLPRMQLDIVLAHPDPDGAGSRRIVVDTKFTSVTTTGYRRAESLKTGYIYQMYSYLMSQAGLDGSSPSEGLMLHPSVGTRFDEYVVIQGRRIRFFTVDLNASGAALKGEFLRAVADPMPN